MSTVPSSSLTSVSTLGNAAIAQVHAEAHPLAGSRAPRAWEAAPLLQHTHPADQGLAAWPLVAPTTPSGFLRRKGQDPADALIASETAAGVDVGDVAVGDGLDEGAQGVERTPAQYTNASAEPPLAALRLPEPADAFVPSLGAPNQWVLGQPLLFDGLGGGGLLMGSVGATVTAGSTGSSTGDRADSASSAQTGGDTQSGAGAPTGTPGGGDNGQLDTAADANTAPASASPPALSAQADTRALSVQSSAIPPRFVFEAERRWNENTGTQTVVYDVNARDFPDAPFDRNIRYAIAGPDAGFFRFDVPTGEVRFLQVPDVESDQSADGNQFYEVWVSATDLAKNTSHMRLVVELIDLEEDGVVLGSGAADLIDANYLGDPNADRIDDGWGARFSRGRHDNLVRAGAGDDTVYGGLGNDTIDGGAGNDFMFGGQGDDVFVIQDGFGQDNVIGGSEGETWGDLLDASAVSSPLSLVMSSADSGFLISINGSGEQVGFSEIERFVLGMGNDILNTFSTAGVHVDGGAGNDWLSGGAGADSLAGGAGNDSLYGGAGNDSLSGGASSDRLEGGDGNDLLRVGAGDTALGGAGQDRFTVDDRLPGDADILLVGGSGEDVLDLRGLSGVTLVFDGLTSGTASFRNSANQTVNIAFSEIELVQTGALSPLSSLLDTQAVI